MTMKDDMTMKEKLAYIAEAGAALAEKAKDEDKEMETTLYINGVPVRVHKSAVPFVEATLKEHDKLRQESLAKPHISELRRELSQTQIKESEKLWQARYEELQRQFKETQKFLKMAQKLKLQQDTNAAMKRIRRLSAEISKLDEEKLNKALTSPKEILGEQIGLVIDGVEYVSRSRAEMDIWNERRKGRNGGLIFGAAIAGLVAFGLYQNNKDQNENK